MKAPQPFHNPLNSEPPARRSGGKRSIYWLVYSIPVAIACMVLELARSTIPQVPGPENLLLIWACLSLALYIKSAYSRMVMLFWILWFLIGTTSFYWAQANRISVLATTSPDPNLFATIYLSFVLSAILGIIFNEKFWRAPASLDVETPKFYTLPSAASSILLFGFPLAYALSIYLTLGSFPMFSGRGFVDEMYNISYGPLQPFGVIIVVSSILTASYFKMDKRTSVSPLRWTILLMPIFLIASIVDGRRLLALMVFICFGLIWFAHEKIKKSAPQILIIFSGTIILYFAAQLLRTNGNIHISDPRQLIGALGVEYIDSVYAVNSFSPESVQSAGFDWVRSTTAALVNTQLLGALGINKLSWIAHDSARTFMRFFNVLLGIRLGLQSELWFAFGWFGLLAMFLFGFVISRISDAITRQKALLGKIFLIAVLGNFAMAVMGQSTVVFGLLPTLLYFYIGLRILDMGRATPTARAKIVSTRYRQDKVAGP